MIVAALFFSDCGHFSLVYGVSDGTSFPSPVALVFSLLACGTVVAKNRKNGPALFASRNFSASPRHRSGAYSTAVSTTFSVFDSTFFSFTFSSFRHRNSG